MWLILSPFGHEIEILRLLGEARLACSSCCWCQHQQSVGERELVGELQKAARKYCDVVWYSLSHCRIEQYSLPGKAHLIFEGSALNKEDEQRELFWKYWRDSCLPTECRCSIQTVWKSKIQRHTSWFCFFTTILQPENSNMEVCCILSILLTTNTHSLSEWQVKLSIIFDKYAPVSYIVISGKFWHKQKTQRASRI